MLNILGFCHLLPYEKYLPPLTNVLILNRFCGFVADGSNVREKTYARVRDTYFQLDLVEKKGCTPEGGVQPLVLLIQREISL
jgi:hypothetical protein